MTGLKIRYSDGRNTEHGEFTFEEKYSFDIEPGERIKTVLVGSGWLIDRLGFTTDSGTKYGPYGGPGGNERIIGEGLPDTRFLSYVKGGIAHTQSHEAIVELSLVFHYYNLESNEKVRPPPYLYMVSAEIDDIRAEYYSDDGDYSGEEWSD